MTNWIWLLIVASVAIGVTYTILGLQARDHLNKSARDTDRSVGWLFWWSFSKEKYDEEGQRLCGVGQVLAYLLIVMYGAWYFVLLK